MENVINFIQTNHFLQTSFWGNAVYDWLGAILIFLAALLILKIFKLILIGRLKTLSAKTKTEIDDMVIDALGKIHWPLYVLVAIYFSLFFVNVNFLVKEWASYIFLIAVVYYAITFLGALIDYGVKVVAIKRKEKEGDVGIVKFSGAVMKIILWAGAVVLILGNMGYNVTSLIAGLGIGGIAIALALQNILGDLFSSLAIYFDKPFKVGDFIVIGEYMGTVKRVGIKTTRIEALQGEEIVIPNNELTNAKLQNFGLMEKRRIVFTIGVTYDTPASKLKKIPTIIRKIIKEQENSKIDRVHFKTFGDSSLIYEIVYYIDSSEYTIYMNAQQEINLGIVKEFTQEKIEMAFPTQTLYVKKEEEK